MREVTTNHGNQSFDLDPPNVEDQADLRTWSSHVTREVNYCRTRLATLGKENDDQGTHLQALGIAMGDIVGIKQDAEKLRKKVSKLNKLRVQGSAIAGAIVFVGGLVGWWVQAKIETIEKTLANAADDHKVIVGPPPLSQKIDDITTRFDKFKSAQAEDNRERDRRINKALGIKDD